PPSSTLFPYTTLFRSLVGEVLPVGAIEEVGHPGGQRETAALPAGAQVGDRPAGGGGLAQPGVDLVLARRRRLLDLDEPGARVVRSEEHTSELQSRENL